MKVRWPKSNGLGEDLNKTLLDEDSMSCVRLSTMTASILYRRALVSIGSLTTTKTLFSAATVDGSTSAEVFVKYLQKSKKLEEEK